MAIAFCYENLAEHANTTVVASSEASGFEKENAYDWRSYSFWKPTSSGTETLTFDLGSAKSVDYGAFYAHDLHTQGATITLRYSTDNFAADDNVAFVATPTTSAPIIRTFTSKSKRYWRWQVTGGSGAASIGVAAFGARLDSPEGPRTGFEPPTFARFPDVLNNRSEAGSFIGRRIHRKGVKFKITLDYLTPAWIRSNWGTFQDHFEIKPFFVSWDQATQETSGTATSGAAGYIVITDTTSPSDYYKDMIVTIESGTGAGQERTISTYSAGTCFVSPVWTTAPDATSVYSIRDPNYEDEAVFCWANGTQSAPIYSQEKFISINMDMVGLYL